MKLNEKTIRERNLQMIASRYEEIIKKEGEEKEKFKTLEKTAATLILALFFGTMAYLAFTIPAQEELSEHNAKVYGQEEGNYYGRHLKIETEYKKEYDSRIYMNK